MYYSVHNLICSATRLFVKRSTNLAKIAICLIALLASGFVGCACSIGPGCHTGNCFDCDGTAGRPLAHGPLDGLRQMKRQLTCGGGGCGEVYVGEWISTPPNVCDPCCGDRFVGGATPCRPFCWQPGSLLASLRLSGRFSDGCGTDNCGCHDGFQDDYFSHGAVDGPVYHDNVGGDGCATCSQPAYGGTRMASRGHVGQPARHPQPQRLTHAPRPTPVPHSSGQMRQAQRPVQMR